MAIVASMYVATYLLNNANMNMFMIGAWGVTGYLGMILTPSLAKKYNYRQLYYLSAVVAIAACAALYFLGYTNQYAIFICMAVAGFPYGVVSNINYAMIADSVDYVEWKTGKRTEGVSISFQTLMNKLMTALQVTTVSFLLYLIKFVQPKEINDIIVIQPQTDLTLNGIFLMITLLPILGWILCTIPMRYYDFIGDIRKRAHIELMERRKANEIQ